MLFYDPMLLCLLINSIITWIRRKYMEDMQQRSVPSFRHKNMENKRRLNMKSGALSNY